MENSIQTGLARIMNMEGLINDYQFESAIYAAGLADKLSSDLTAIFRPDDLKLK